MIKKLSLILSTLVVTAFVTSCGGAPDEEIIAALGELAPKAVEMHGVVYGDTVPHGEADESGMCVVSPESKYTGTDQINTALYEVFSDEYAEIIGNTAFRGVIADEGEINPKFFEQDGILYVNPSATENFEVIESINTEGCKVTKKNKFMAIVELPQNEGSEDDMEITLRYTENGWRIDNIKFINISEKWTKD